MSMIMFVVASTTTPRGMYFMNMPPTGAAQAGLVAVTVHVPAINCRAVLCMTFPAPSESTRGLGGNCL